MNSALEGLLADFVEVALNPEVPAHEVGVLAQELNTAVTTDATQIDTAIRGLSALFDAQGPTLYIASVLVGGWIEQGGAPQGAKRLLGRLPQWLEAAASGDEAAQLDLHEVWRPLVAILGAWPEMRLKLAETVSAHAAALPKHPAGLWLGRLLAVAPSVPLWIYLPDRKIRVKAEASGVVDIMQLSLLINSTFEDLDPRVGACARGEGAQTRAQPVKLPRVLTEADGEVLPEGAPCSILVEDEGRKLVVAMLNPEPFERPVGRVFSTLAAGLRILDEEPIS
jgi:hypothetical protein